MIYSFKHELCCYVCKQCNFTNAGFCYRKKKSWLHNYINVVLYTETNWFVFSNLDFGVEKEVLWLENTVACKLNLCRWIQVVRYPTAGDRESDCIVGKGRVAYFIALVIIDKRLLAIFLIKKTSCSSVRKEIYFASVGCWQRKGCFFA